MIRVIARKVYAGKLNKQKMRYFNKLIRDELRDVFDNDYEVSSEIIITDEEMDGFYIVKAILSEIVDSDRISMRDRQSYCAIFFDDNQNYTICRLYFNDLDNLTIAFFDSMAKDKDRSRIEEKIGITKVNEIYKYKKKLLDTVRAYKKVKK